MKHYTLSCLTIFFVIVFVGCNSFDNRKSVGQEIDSVNKAQPIQNTNSNIANSKVNEIENKILDTIFQLKEIKERQNYIEQQTKGERRLKLWISSKPDSTQKYYWVHAGEDNGTNLVTHFNFFVYPDSLRIMYFDTQDDREIPIEEWRNTKSL